MHTYKESDPEVRQRVMGVGYKMKLGGKARVDVCVCVWGGWWFRPHSPESGLEALMSG